MNAYVYCGALYCEKCANAIKADTRHVRGYLPPDPDDENYDSDIYPKGPYADGGGESDVPNHCEACDIFLENPLTLQGECWLREQAEDTTIGVPVVWLRHYDYLFPASECEEVETGREGFLRITRLAAN